MAIVTPNATIHAGSNPFEFQPRAYLEGLLNLADGYLSLSNKDIRPISELTEPLPSENTLSYLTTSFKVVSYATLIIPAIMLIVRPVLRYAHAKIYARQILEEGIEITNETTEKLTAIIQYFRENHQLENKADSTVKWIAPYTGDNCIFTLESQPNLIFKIPAGISSFDKAGDERQKKWAEHRFANMIKAQETCLTHQRKRLI